MTVMTELISLAAVKQHRLSPDMLNGRREVTEKAAIGMVAYLRRCPDKEGCDMSAPRTTRDTQALAATGAPVRLRFQDVPGGFYAVMRADGTSQADFWKVTVSRNGDYRSVKRVIGGGSTKYPQLVEISRPQQVSALRSVIKAGIDESNALYATLETRCMDCGIHLTDEESIAAGKGPVCRNR